MKDVKKIIRDTIDSSLSPTFTDNLKSEIVEEIFFLYTDYQKLLDHNWLERFSRAISSRAALLELAFIKHFRNNLDFKLTEYQGDSAKSPDFEIITCDNKHFLIELTSVKLPTNLNSELTTAYNQLKNTGKLSTSDYNFGNSVNEYKARLIQAIVEKTKYRELVINEEKGFILFVSFGEIPFGVKPDTFHLVHALYGMGEFSYFIKPDTNQIQDMSYNVQETFKKNDAVSLSNKCLQDNPWISAVILSAIEAYYLFDFAKPELGAFWSDLVHHDFVLVHNPWALLPLKKGLFPRRTEISYDTDRGVLLQEGSAIFPDYCSILRKE